MALRPVYRFAYRLLAPVSPWFRARVYRRAIDATAELTSGRTLVLAPHPDDETLGCGATLMRTLDAGGSVHVVVATDGGGSHAEAAIARDALVARRRVEALEAARVLGLPDDAVTFLDHPDGALAQHADRVREQLAALLDELRPDRVLVTSALDAHDDHRALARAAREAVGASEVVPALYEYPIWYWERLPWTHRPRTLVGAAWHVVRDPVAELRRAPALKVAMGDLIERKRAAIQAHRSQVAPLDDGATSAAHLPPAFVGHFLQPYEIFFAVAPAPVAGAATGTKATGAPRA